MVLMKQYTNTRALVKIKCVNISFIIIYIKQVQRGKCMDALISDIFQITCSIVANTSFSVLSLENVCTMITKIASCREMHKRC